MVRNLIPSDAAAAAQVTAHAFDIEHTRTADRAADLEKQITAGPNLFYGYFDGDEITASAQLVPLRIYLYGVSVPMYGIGGVASLPEYRRGGRVAQIMKEMIRSMKERGVTSSMLAPFSYSFYRKYGYEQVCEFTKYTLPLSSLDQFVKSSGRTRLAKSGDAQLIREIYNKYARQTNCMADRTEDWWEKVTPSYGLSLPRGSGRNVTYIYENENGEAEGYMSYTFRDRVFEVREIAFTHYRALAGFMGLAYTFGNHPGTFVITLPASFSLREMLTDPRTEAVTQAGMMFRVVDVINLVQSLRFCMSLNETVRLNISDPCAEWNDGAFSFRFSDGRCAVTPCAEAGAKCDIQTFSRLVSGCGADGLRFSGALTCSDSEYRTLSAAFPKTDRFIADGF